MIGLPLLAALVLSLVHIFASKLRFLHTTPRSIWLSAASGVSVAYVFLHLLPEVSAGQQRLKEAIGERAGLDEEHAFLVALIGVTTFYGLERLAKTSRRQQRASEGEDETSPGVFWIHIISFAVYNALIGYLLIREEEVTRSLGIFTLAMALHFFVNDYGLHEHHKQRYVKKGRWILACAVLIGWAVGAWTEVHKLALTLLLAFLGGGVVLNVLKEELPEERQSRFWAFLLGGVAYSALLLAL